MGLDMYLSAELYVSGWNHSGEEAATKYNKICELIGVPRYEAAPSLTVKANVGYWRKANAIHAWFVKHVQDGVDECQKSEVTREQLQDLLSRCQQVLASAEFVPAQITTSTTYRSG